MGAACCQSRPVINHENERNTLEKEGASCDCIGNPYALVEFTVVDIEENKSDDDEKMHRKNKKQILKRKRQMYEHRRKSLVDKNDDISTKHKSKNNGSKSKPEYLKLKTAENFSKMMKEEDKKSSFSNNIESTSPTKSKDNESKKFKQMHRQLSKMFQDCRELKSHSSVKEIPSPEPKSPTKMKKKSEPFGIIKTKEPKSPQYSSTIRNSLS